MPNGYNAYGGGGYLPGPDPNGGQFDERKKQLLQWLAGRGAQGAGYRGRVGSAVGRMGGLGGRGPLPSLTYNPFISQIAGRPNEVFSQLPAGLSSAAAQAAQTGPLTGGMGLTPNGGGNFGTGIDAAPGVVHPTGDPGRNLIGVGATPPVAQPGMLGNLNNPGQPQLQPYDPYAYLQSITGRGNIRTYE